MAQPTAMFDAQLRHAVGLHQAQRLAEAEAAYQQLLAHRPDLADVQVNCALAQLGQGKYRDAENSLRNAIAAQPALARAHAYLGDALCFQQRHQDALPSYERAIQLKPDFAEAYNNHGNALALLGRNDQAAPAYRKAVALKPGFAQASNNLGLIYLAEGRASEAQTAFEHAIAVAPGYFEAHSNLGTALHKQGRGQQARQAFETAIKLAPNYADAYLALSVHLFDIGEFAQAAAMAQRAVKLAPTMPEALNALGNALRGQGEVAAAVDKYRQALRLSPRYAEGYKHLAMALEELGQLDEAFTLFRRHGELGFTTGPQSSPPSPHKLRHDEEQRAWRGGASGVFHLGDGGRIEGPAVNRANAVSEISAQWLTKRPQIVVIDDLLSPQALEKLRGFCLESTIWQQIYDGGYLGAFPEHGFAPPLLAQIADELRLVYPQIIEDYPLLHFWAFKYGSDLHGIKKHADFAAVNVNFWITPDEANLDPEHGGLVVWDTAAPLDWNFAKYNAAENDICAFLEEQKAKPITVPYRANRAVIFDSDLFHETDVIRFKPGYENRRINVTLLFGRRQTQRATE